MHVDVDRDEFTQHVLDGAGVTELANYFGCTVAHVKYLKGHLRLTSRKPRVDLPNAAAFSEL